MLQHLDAMIEHEQGTLEEATTLELFAALIKSGDAWRLQGHYGRTATNLIAHGIINGEGELASWH